MDLIRRMFSKPDPRLDATDEPGDLIPMRPEVRRLALAAKGFLSEQEGDRLFILAQRCSQVAPCVEIGSYCGKSTLFLAEGCRYGRYNLLSIDHHRGSAEQQPGEQYFDPELFDRTTEAHDSLPVFLQNLGRANLLDCVVPVLGDSVRVASNMQGLNLSLVFIDGGHAESDVRGDFDEWSRMVVPGGYVCFHDIYLKAEEGGQAPRRVWEQAQSQGMWRYVGLYGTLGVLRRCR